MNKMMKKSWLLVVLLILVVAIGVGCSSNTDSVSENEKTVDSQQANTTGSEPDNATEELEQKVEMISGIAVNLPDGSMKSAKVDLAKLIAYIDNAKEHTFNYEEASDTLKFELEDNKMDDESTSVDDGKKPLSEVLKDTPIQFDEQDGMIILTSTLSPENSVRLTNVAVVGKYIVGNAEGEELLSVYDFNLDLKLSNKFLEFYHIAEDYYAGSSYENAAEYDEFIHEFMFTSPYTRDYRVDAIYDGENLTPFKYFVIRYLGEDVFYLSNGNSFYFMNLKTGEQLYTHVETDFIADEFAIYDGLIVGSDKDDNQILITDNNYVVTAPFYQFDDFTVSSKFYSKGLISSLYPKFEMGDSAIADIINSQIHNEYFDVDVWDGDFNESKTAVNSLENHSFDILKKGQFVTVAKNDYFNSFGAHPYSGTRYYMFDISTGSIVNQKNIFKNLADAKKMILSEMAHQAIEQSNDDDIQIYGIESLKNAENIEEVAHEVFLGDDSNNFNFAFTDEGMKILYNPYELAPYAVGEIRYVISYELIKEYFTTGVMEKLNK